MIVTSLIDEIPVKGFYGWDDISKYWYIFVNTEPSKSKYRKELIIYWECGKENSYINISDNKLEEAGNQLLVKIRYGQTVSFKLHNHIFPHEFHSNRNKVFSISWSENIFDKYMAKGSVPCIEVSGHVKAGYSVNKNIGELKVKKVDDVLLKQLHNKVHTIIKPTKNLDLICGGDTFVRFCISTDKMKSKQCNKSKYETIT